MAEPDWQLFDFERTLRAFIERDRPAEHQWKAAARWVLELPGNPYKDARREPAWEDLWFLDLPDTLDALGRVVCCAMFIDPLARSVRCASITLLGHPVKADQDPDDEEDPFS